MRKHIRHLERVFLFLSVDFDFPEMAVGLSLGIPELFNELDIDTGGRTERRKSRPGDLRQRFCKTDR